jgi:hypothetical protein
MVLTYDAYNETLEIQKEKEDNLASMEEQFQSMRSQMQMLTSSLDMMDQSSKNAFARQLYTKGLDKKDEFTGK